MSVAYDCWAYRRLGVLIDPASGALSWPTSEATGPSVNPVTVQVQDILVAGADTGFKADEKGDAPFLFADFEA